MAITDVIGVKDLIPIQDLLIVRWKIPRLG